MSDDTETGAPEAGTSADEHANTATDNTVEQEASEQDAESEAEAPEPEPPEEIEFDFGGNKLRVPKGSLPDDIAERLDQFTKGTWSDYTRKSQEVAEARKAMEAERSVVQKLGTLRNDALTAYATGLQLRQEIEQLSQVDTNALWQSNPDQARRVSDLLSQKQSEFQRTVAKVSQSEAAASQEEAAHVARTAEEGRAKVLRTVKGFDEAKVVDYAVKTYGLSEEAAKSWPLNPAGAIMAHKAMLFDKMQAQATKAVAKPATPPAAPVQPLRSKSATVDRDPEKMSDDEWVKWREAQIAKSRRR